MFRLFNKARDVADGPLKAAEAYQRIVDALRSAEEAAKNASAVATEAFNAVSCLNDNVGKTLHV